MTPPTRESLRYFSLLLLLLTTGAIAAGTSISFLDKAVPNVTDRLIVSIIIWTLTMGFMLIAGAFGLWTIHFAAEAESLRRISRLVDHMNDISDGILAIDKNARIIGINTAAESIFGQVRGQSLQSICRDASEQDLQNMLHAKSVVEQEYTFQQIDRPQQTLRFRAQPSISGVSLILVNDITSVATAQSHQRRAATLQLAGHLAQGIANDFNDLLCGISGHASILQKTTPEDGEGRTSMDAIQLCADRGIKLARQLSHLSQSQLEQSESVTTRLALHVKNGAELLESSLNRKWKVESIIEPTPPPVNIPPSQIEHMIHSLGSIVSETHHGSPGTICVCLRLPEPQERTSAPGRTAAIVEIYDNTKQGMPPAANPSIDSLPPENGVISSLVETLLSQAGGKLEAYPDGRRAHHFRLYLPEVDTTTLAASNEQEDTLALGLEAYTAGWHVLLCMPPDQSQQISTFLQQKNIHVQSAHDENAFLQQMASSSQYEVIFIQPDLLGQHFASFFPILLRISPESAIVLLSNAPPDNLPSNVVYLNPASAPSKWIHAMIDARSRRVLPHTESVA
jgi:nitrogen-specific signal transduction histidine kinase